MIMHSSFIYLARLLQELNFSCKNLEKFCNLLARTLPKIGVFLVTWLDDNGKRAKSINFKQNSQGTQILKYDKADYFELFPV